MNPFMMAFANSYDNGEKLRPDLATSYQETAPQPDYGFSYGGQSMGQTASQAPAPTPYTQAQANAYVAANPPAPANNGFTIGGSTSAPVAPTPAPAQAPAAQTQQTYTPNPYLGQMANSITNQVQQNLSRNIMPGISSGAMSTGGYGGSRQGVVEANALNDVNQGLSNSLANLYGNDWTNAQNRNLQQQSLDNSYNLGLGNLGLNAQVANNNFYTAQRGQDLQGYGLGAQLIGQSNQGFLNQGQGLYNIGNTTQQAPWGTIGNYQSVFQPFSGLNSSTTTNQSSNPWANALGGAIGGAQLARYF